MMVVAVVAVDAGAAHPCGALQGPAAAPVMPRCTVDFQLLLADTGYRLADYAGWGVGSLYTALE